MCRSSLNDVSHLDPIRLLYTHISYTKKNIGTGISYLKTTNASSILRAMLRSIMTFTTAPNIPRGRVSLGVDAVSIPTLWSGMCSTTYPLSLFLLSIIPRSQNYLYHCAHSPSSSPSHMGASSLAFQLWLTYQSVDSASIIETVLFRE